MVFYSSIIDTEETDDQEVLNGEKDKPLVYDFNLSLELVNVGGSRTLEHGRRVWKRNGTTDLETATLEICVPPGTLAGTRFIYPGVGDRTTAKKPGDVILMARDLPHQHLVREKEHLIYTMKIDYKDAHQGTIVTIPTLDGPLMYNVCRPKPTEVIIGKGLPVMGDVSRRGDLHVNFVYNKTPTRVPPITYGYNFNPNFSFPSIEANASSGANISVTNIFGSQG